MEPYSFHVLDEEFPVDNMKIFTYNRKKDAMILLTNNIYSLLCNFMLGYTIIPIVNSTIFTAQDISLRLLEDYLMKIYT